MTMGPAADLFPYRASVSDDELARAAVVAFGANLENPLEMLREAAGKLAGAKGLRLLAASSVYLTEPQGGPPGQNWYHNAAAFFQSELGPHELLALLLETEKLMGRRRLERWGPRVIDLDLIAFGPAIINDPPDLILPHPRMSERLFVIAPLAEMRPQWRHPVSGRTAADMGEELKTAGQGLKMLAKGSGELK